MSKQIIFIVNCLICCMMMSCSNADTSSDTPETPSTTEQANAETPVKKEAIELPTKGLKSVTLPGGKEISFKEGGMTSKVIEFLNADEQDFSQSIMITGVIFKEDNEVLGGNQRELDNLATLLNLYEDYGIKVNSSSPDTKTDKVLAANRAKAVKAFLVKKGIKNSRIQTTSKQGTEDLQLSLQFTE